MLRDNLNTLHCHNVETTKNLPAQRLVHSNINGREESNRKACEENKILISRNNECETVIKYLNRNTARRAELTWITFLSRPTMALCLCGRT